MFSDIYRVAIDTNRRIYIPPRFRQELTESFFIMPINNHLCIMNPEILQHYSDIWQKINNAIFKRNIFASIDSCDIDVKGRICISHRLAERAYLTRRSTAVLVGMGTYIDLYNEEIFNELEASFCDDVELSEFLFIDKTRSLPGIRYGDGIINCTEIFLPKKIISPPQELISNLIITNKSLLSKIKENESLIEKLSSREFEELVCEILEKNGLSVKLTKQTRDGGKDIIVCESKLIGNFLTYVECKKYRKNRPVSIGLVRELYGTIMADNATAGLLVTTSYFSKDAEEWTEKVKHRMSLMDYNGLLQTISNTKI